jgi:hypothetical protein
MELRSIDRQPFLLKTRAGGQVILHQPAAVGRQAVLDQDLRGFHMPLQVGQGLDALGPFDCSRKEPKTELCEGHARDHRQAWD